jgi:hypothetical protein
VVDEGPQAPGKDSQDRARPVLRILHGDPTACREALTTASASPAALPRAGKPRSKRAATMNRTVSNDLRTRDHRAHVGLTRLSAG